MNTFLLTGLGLTGLLHFLETAHQETFKVD